jgi:dipeptide/tripeptide permease
MALPGSFPVSALNMFDTIAILLLIPLFDQLLFPALKRVGYPLGMLSKISFGFGAAIISMLIAAVVELARKNNINTEAALPSSCGEGSGVTRCFFLFPFEGGSCFKEVLMFT